MSKQQELAATAEGTATTNNTQLVATESVENTPFHIVSHDDGHFLALGGYKLTKNLPTKNDVHEHLKINFWEILLNVVTVLIQAINQQNLKDANTNNQ